MTLLANATVDGADFSEDEFCWFYLMLIIAGTETTRYSLSGAIEALHDQGLWPAVVAGPQPIPSAAVDELVRYVSPVMHLRRTATREADLAGQHIRAGDKVVMWLGAANRDPAVFDDPHKLVLDRDPNPHIAFGCGVHFCLGTRLARLQLSTMLSELATQCPNLKVVAPPQRMLSTFLHAVESLPVAV
jgi:cytochrome P450